jgi:methyl-accepting chemotaxis protein
VGEETAKSNQSTIKGATVMMISFAVAGVALAITLGLYISRGGTRPLADGVNVAKRLAEGDLTVDVIVESHDETGQLMEAMQTMVHNLRDMITSTVDISTSIASASNQLQSTAQQIATGAEEVAAQTSTVATASEEMAATSSDIARNCTMAADASQQSADAAHAGASVVQETITG